MGERERAIADYQQALSLSPNMHPQYVSQCKDALKRLGTVDETAKVVMFFASDLASFVNGQVLAVDGGLTLV